MTDPRDNPNVPSPPPKEPIRTAYSILALVVTLIGIAAVWYGQFTVDQLIAFVTTLGSLVGAAILLFERVRSMVNSPATSAQNAAVRDALAQAVRQAELTGQVPKTAAEVADKVLEGAASTVIPAALAAAAAAVGLSPVFVAAASPAAVQAAIDAVHKATVRVPNQAETDAAALK